MAMVENRCSQLSLLTSVLLIITFNISVVSGQSEGVHLSLNERTVPNDSYVLASGIGENDGGLLCNTDGSDCCIINRQGRWYFPNGSSVVIEGGRAGDFFYRNRGTRVVRLNRRGTPSERGRFRCEIPDADGATVTMYVNIVNMLPTPPPPTTTAPPPVSITDVSITSSGTNTAGESYSLECTVTVTGSTDQPTIIWLDPMDNTITSGVVMTGSMSTLTFNPLVASHAGTYTCRATLDGAMDSASRTITVQNPAITVSVSSSVATPMVGSMYSLTCTVTGAESLTDAMMTYQWFKNGVVVSGQTMATLSFSPLTFSAAASYTCEATVTSSLLSAPITTTSSNSLGVQLTLPRPTTVRVSTNQVNPLMVRPVGSTVTLTCMADLDPAIDVPVTVNIQLSDPAGRTLTTTTPSVSGSTYTTTTMISSFGRDQSGEYTCIATVVSSPPSSFLSNSSPQSGTLRLTIGVYLLLDRMVYSNNSGIPITEIGTTYNTRLQCITDRMPCCSAFGTRVGQWFFPDGMSVPTQVGGATTFYRDRGDDGTVNLNRLSTNIMMPTGLFCCVVPDAINVMQRVCASIITTSVTVRITSSEATPTLGQSYSLTCEVTGTDDTINTYQWMKGGTILSETGPTLSFSSLRLSDAEQYTCQVTVDGMMFSSSQDIRLTIPPPAPVSITSNPSSPVNVMSTITVNCTVELNPVILESDLSLLMVSAQLTHPSRTILSLSNTIRGKTFTYTTRLNSFGRNDSGNYTCTANIRPQPTATFLTGTGVLSDTIEITVRVMVQVNFQFIGNKESMDISFSLTCSPTGGQANSVVWTRDGSLLHNTSPPVQTDASTLSYTNVLMVSGRTPGTYTCTIRGPSDQVLNSANFTVQASSPPVNVVVTQSSSSAPVEVSWSTPTDAAPAIIGYRIFYGSGQNFLVPSSVTSIVFNFVESNQIESILIRSESVQLPSELITATMTTVDKQSSSEALCTCSGEVGIAVGVVILVVGIIAAVIVVSYWLMMRRRKSGKSDFAVSANVAYGEVKLEALEDVGGEYEDPDKLARSGRAGGGNYEPTGCPAPYESPVSKPEAPVYATADDTTNSGKTMQ